MKHPLNTSQPYDGALTPFDVTGFNAGPGTPGIQRELRNPVTGTGCRSAAEKYLVAKTAAPTWQ